MRIAITGATGFIGRRILHRLLGEGHTVHALGRKNAYGGAVAFSPWDAFGDSPPPPASLEGADAVIHLAGEPVAQRWTAEARHRILTSRVNGTARLVDGLARAIRRPRVLVSASAIGYYGARGDEVLTERSGPGSGFLPEVCIEWENAAERAVQLGIRVVRIRIGIVLGREGGALARMLPAFKLGAGGRMGSGEQWMSWIHVDDLAGLVRFALDASALNGPVNATAPNPVRNAEFTSTLASVLHRPALLFVPGFALKAAMGEMAGVVLESQRVLPSAALAAGYRFAFTDLRQALENLFQSGVRRQHA